MKVNMDQKPGKKPDKSGIKEKLSAGTAGKSETANIYRESLKGYRDKWKEQLAGGGIFRRNRFWVISAVVLFIIFLSVNGNANSMKTYLIRQQRSTAAETEKLNAAITEVKADLEEQAKIDAAKLTQQEEEMARNNAIEQGTLVASLQNAYSRILPPSTEDPNYRTLNDKYLNELNENKDALDIFFGEHDKNARTEWYSSLSGIPGTWEFASKASFMGNTAKVLWLCYANEDRTLLAYCTARYNADTKLFTDVEWHMTSYASSHVRSDEGTGTDTEQITSVQDALKALAGDDSMQGADPAFDADTIRNNNDVSDGREAYKESVAEGSIPGEEYDPNYNVGLGSTVSSNSSGMEGGVQ